MGETKQPQFSWCTCSVKQAVAVAQAGLDDTFSWVLVLMVWFALPSRCHKITQEVLGAIADHVGIMVADQLSWGSPIADVVLACAKELVVSFETTKVGDS